LVCIDPLLSYLLVSVPICAVYFDLKVIYIRFIDPFHVFIQMLSFKASPFVRNEQKSGAYPSSRLKPTNGPAGYDASFHSLHVAWSKRVERGG